MESEVWKHFKKNSNDSTAQCNRCSKSLSCKGSTTSSLIRHLNTVHNIALKRRQANDNVIIENTPSTSAGLTHSQTTVKKPGPNTLDKYLKVQTRSEIIAKLIAKDGINSYVISKSSFIRESFVKRGLTLPKNHSDVMKACNEFYEYAKNETIKSIKHILMSNAKLGLTLDEWTSKGIKRYLNVNVHSKLIVINLGLIRIMGSCPAEKALQLLEALINKFELKFSDLIGGTTDAASVMVKLFKNLNIFHQLCYNHAIHLAVLDVLNKKNELVNSVIVDNDESFSSNGDEDDNNTDSPQSDESEYPSSSEEDNHDTLRTDLKEVLDRIRKVVKIFKNSPVRNNILQSYVKEHNGKELKVLLDCKTRWNSSCTMIERFLSIQSSIQKALVDLNMQDMLQIPDLKKIEELLQVLNPIKLAVEALSKNDANLLAAEGVIKFLFNALSNQNSGLSTEMLESLKHRISQRRNNSLISLMRFLQNPKCIQSNKVEDSFFKMASKTEIIKKVKEVSIIVFNENQTTNESVDEISSDDSLQCYENDGPSSLSLPQELNNCIEKVRNILKMYTIQHKKKL